MATREGGKSKPDEDIERELPQSAEDDITRGATARDVACSSDDSAVGMTVLQNEGVFKMKEESQREDGAVGGRELDTPSTVRQQTPMLSGATSSPPVPGHWGMERASSLTKIIKTPPSVLLPKVIPEIRDQSESLLRDSFIKHMTKYEGPAIAPDEEFELNWITIEDDLEQSIAEGLVPQDSIASSGLDETSYEDFKRCAEELQSNLYEGKLRECLSNLRGFRELFSRSSDVVLQHAFRGRPVEVLQNIYYGGDGILPEDRMQKGDPFHFMKKDNSALYMFDD